MSTTSSVIYNICLLAVWTAFLWKNLTPRFSFRVTMLICVVVDRRWRWGSTMG